MKLTRKQWMMLVVLVLGAFVTVLNQTLVTPALPSIMTEMNVDQSTAQWLTTGFTLVNAIMIPITAFLQDRFSTRKLFVFSMSLFAVGTLLAADGRREGDDQAEDAHGRTAAINREHQHEHGHGHRHEDAGAGGLHEAPAQKHREVEAHSRQQRAHSKQAHREHEQLPRGEPILQKRRDGDHDGVPG